MNSRFILAIAIAGSAAAGCKGSSSSADAAPGGGGGGGGGDRRLDRGSTAAARWCGRPAGTGATAGSGVVSAALGHRWHGRPRGNRRPRWRRRWRRRRRWIPAVARGPAGARVGCASHDIDVPAADVRGSLTVGGMSEVGSFDIGYGLG